MIYHPLIFFSLLRHRRSRILHFDRDPFMACLFSLVSSQIRRPSSRGLTFYYPHDPQGSLPISSVGKFPRWGVICGMSSRTCRQLTRDRGWGKRSPFTRHILFFGVFVFYCFSFIFFLFFLFDVLINREALVWNERRLVLCCINRGRFICRRNFTRFV